MSAATPPNESLADAVALIAVCKRSVALMEVALALQVVANGVTAVPEEARKNRLFARVHCRLTSAAWLAAARVALGNEGLGRVAACFRAACFEYATPTTAAFYDDEDWLRGLELYYLFEENMRVLADMILELMRLPEVDVEPRQAPATTPRPVASAPPAPVVAPQPAMPPQPAPQCRMVAPSAEWAIPIALIAIGKADRNPLWVSFGATVGCLSGFWTHVAAKKMLEAPRGFEMASALLHDPVLRTASQAMMMRWHAVAGEGRQGVSSDGLREAMVADAELAVRGDAVLRATCIVMQTLVRPGPAPSAKVASEAPPVLSPPVESLPEASSVRSPKPVPSPAVTPQRMNVSPTALRLMPARATPKRARRAHLTRDSQQVTWRRTHRMPGVESLACRLPPQRSRAPPALASPCRRKVEPVRKEINQNDRGRACRIFLKAVVLVRVTVIGNPTDYEPRYVVAPACFDQPRRLHVECFHLPMQLADLGLLARVAQEFVAARERGAFDLDGRGSRAFMGDSREQFGEARLVGPIGRDVLLHDVDQSVHLWPGLLAWAVHASDDGGRFVGDHALRKDDAPQGNVLASPRGDTYEHDRPRSTTSRDLTHGSSLWERFRQCPRT